MHYRTLLHKLLPVRGQADTAAPATDFADTRPDDSRAAPPQRAAPARRQLDTAWRETAIDPELATEVVEFPDTASADLLDEFFAGSPGRAN